MRVAGWVYALLAAVALPAGASGQAPGEAGSVAGSVVDARGGEALAHVEVRLIGGDFRAVSDSAGRFHLDAVPSGDYVLNVSTVGYHLVKRPFHLDPGDRKEFEIILASDNFRQTETVTARIGPFDTPRQDNPQSLVLAGNEARNLASVLADDPLRAVQNLPGVSSNDDFDARFSLRGAGFQHIGVYLDGVLLHQPFHTIPAQNENASGTAFNGDMVEELELHPGAFPSRFDDRTGGALDVHTREGARSGITLRAFASASNAGATLEGPLGKSHRGSWLVGARKSYLQYILARTFPDTSLVFGLEDVQARLAYDLTPANKLSLYVLEAYSNLDRTNVAGQLGLNSLVTAGYHYTLGNLGWTSTPGARLLFTNRFAWMREKFNNANPTGLPLAGGFYGEWTWNSSVTWVWDGKHPLDIGWSLRRIRSGGFGTQYSSTTQPRLLDRADGTAERLGAYAQQTWTAWSGRVRLVAGLRWDDQSLEHVPAVSPHASFDLAVLRSTHLTASWGQYVQYPEVNVLTSVLGSTALLPERSNHATAGIEQRFGSRTRLRAEFYNRADRDLLFQPQFDPRIAAGKIFIPPLFPAYANSLRGYARGFEFFLQRSSANGATGWISYAFGRTGMREGVSGSRFPSNYDQRHTINVFGSYRLRPSINLSGKLSYGSGFPYIGYLQRTGGIYVLSASRNALRLPVYQRTDVRVNKSWTRDRSKFTLYGEVINIFNRTNYAFEVLNSFNSKTGQASVAVDKMFPILPSVGLVFER